MNTALRGEMAAFREALQALKDRGTLKAWEVNAVQTAADVHLKHIHAHHDNEDKIFAPEFENRFKYNTVSV
jgi:2-methylisocitrate lyase-like PEP mutase family enzyme